MSIAGMSADPAGLRRAAIEELRRWGGQRAACSGLADHVADHPMRACSACRGGGLVTAGGRPLETGERGRVPERMCPACRGLGRVAMADDEIRAAYAEVRARACERLECAPETFDDLARMWLAGVDAPAPGRWLRVARELAAARAPR